MLQTWVFLTLPLQPILVRKLPFSAAASSNNQTSSSNAFDIRAIVLSSKALANSGKPRSWASLVAPNAHVETIRAPPNAELERNMQFFQPLILDNSSKKRAKILEEDQQDVSMWENS